LCLSQTPNHLKIWELTILTQFLHSLFEILPILFAALSLAFRRRVSLQLENLTLRHQFGVLKRAAPKRPELTVSDRLLWVWLCRT